MDGSRCSLRFPRRAFTLIELLIVVAIILVLLGLLAPALQVVRAAADATACRNNLKQIGAGLLSYHVANSKFPAGSRCRDVNNCYGNWAIYILPHVEQETLWSLFNDSRLNTDPANDTVRKAALSLFTCPTDPTGHELAKPGFLGPGINLFYRPGNYKGNAGLNDGVNQFFDRYDNAEVLINSGKAKWLGPLTVTNARVKLAAMRLDMIDDGVANTFLVGEYTTTTSRKQRGFWAYAYWEFSLSSFPVVIDPASPSTVKPPQPRILSTSYDECMAAGPENPCKRGWSSLHPAGGINFVFCDNSVRTVVRGANMQVLANLATYSGGELQYNFD